jgi:hypothetical protein
MLSSVFRRQHSLANAAMLAHRQGYFLLDKAFALIEGHPADYNPGYLAKNPSLIIQGTCF